MSDADARTPAGEPDLTAAAAMWDAYAAAHPQAVASGAEHTVERFGDSEQLADALLEIVLSGRKRATAELVSEFLAAGEQLPRVGSHWIACDGRGAPRIVIRSTELRVGPFGSVDAAFAADEGEDDGSLASWQDEHRRYWQRTTAARGATWNEQDEIVFERFAVVWPPELADGAVRG
ncbi:ASCH domain-containing protein [Agrococcus baldri]|nr:ASCH domain-containing protein [Agrococcus baldri]